MKDYVKKNQSVGFFDSWVAQDFNRSLQTNSMNLYKILEEGNFTLFNDKNNFVLPVHPNSEFSLLSGEGKKRSKYLKDLIESCISSFPEEMESYKKNSELYIHGFSRILRFKSNYFYHWKVKKGIFHSMKEINQKIKAEVSEANWIPLNAENKYISCMHFFYNWLKKHTTQEYVQLWNTYFNLELKIVPLAKKEKKKEIVSFNRFSKDQLFHFFKHSSSIYHKLCYFFSIYPINNYMSTTEGHKFEKHHIICSYINKNHASLVNLEKDYNKISIPYILHKMLHLVRFIEFRYEEDLVTF